MIAKKNILDSEQGSAIVFALLILTVLTIVGLSSIQTSSVELQIAHNEKMIQKNFYIAESAWKDGAYWLEDNTRAPSKVNEDQSLSEDELKIVRNFGDGAADALNDDFPHGSEDNTIDSIPYWFNVQYQNNAVVPGSGRDYRKFKYLIKSNANKEQELQVGVKKIYKIGY
jgi:Tfp pilus assembly protein PilX